MTSVEGAARVRNGLTIEIGHNVHFYGYADESGIPILAASSVGSNSDERSLVEAFAKPNASDGLAFVDWRQQMVLASAASDGNIDVWRP